METTTTWSKTKKEIETFGDKELMKEMEDVYLFGMFVDDDEYYEDLDENEF